MTIRITNETVLECRCLFVTGTSVLLCNILRLCPLEFLWHLQYKVIVMIHRLHILSWQRFEFLRGIAVQGVLLFINKLVLRVKTSSWCDGKRTMVIKKEGFGQIQHSYIKGFEKENKDVC